MRMLRPASAASGPSTSSLCVYVPDHLVSSAAVPSYPIRPCHVTGVSFSPSGRDVLASYSNENIYSFSTRQHARDYETVLRNARDARMRATTDAVMPSARGRGTQVLTDGPDRAQPAAMLQPPGRSIFQAWPTAGPFHASGPAAPGSDPAAGGSAGQRAGQARGPGPQQAGAAASGTAAAAPLSAGRRVVSRSAAVQPAPLFPPAPGPPADQHAAGALPSSSGQQQLGGSNGSGSNNSSGPPPLIPVDENPQPWSPLGSAGERVRQGFERLRDSRLRLQSLMSHPFQSRRTSRSGTPATGAVTGAAQQTSPDQQPGPSTLRSLFFGRRPSDAGQMDMDAAAGPSQKPAAGPGQQAAVAEAHARREEVVNDDEDYEIGASGRAAAAKRRRLNDGRGLGTSAPSPGPSGRPPRPPGDESGGLAGVPGASDRGLEAGLGAGPGPATAAAAAGEAVAAVAPAAAPAATDWSSLLARIMLLRQQVAEAEARVQETQRLLQGAQSVSVGALLLQREGQEGAAQMVGEAADVQARARAAHTRATAALALARTTLQGVAARIPPPAPQMEQPPSTSGAGAGSQPPPLSGMEEPQASHGRLAPASSNPATNSLQAQPEMGSTAGDGPATLHRQPSLTDSQMGQMSIHSAGIGYDGAQQDPSHSRRGNTVSEAGTLQDVQVGAGAAGHVSVPSRRHTRASSRTADQQQAQHPQPTQQEASQQAGEPLQLPQQHQPQHQPGPGVQGGLSAAHDMEIDNQPAVAPSTAAGTSSNLHSPHVRRSARLAGLGSPSSAQPQVAGAGQGTASAQQGGQLAVVQAAGGQQAAAAAATTSAAAAAQSGTGGRGAKRKRGGSDPMHQDAAQQASEPEAQPALSGVGRQGTGAQRQPEVQADAQQGEPGGSPPAGPLSPSSLIARLRSWRQVRQAPPQSDRRAQHRAPTASQVIQPTPATGPTTLQATTAQPVGGSDAPDSFRNVPLAPASSSAPPAGSSSGSRARAAAPQPPRRDTRGSNVDWRAALAAAYRTGGEAAAAGAGGPAVAGAVAGPPAAGSAMGPGVPPGGPSGDHGANASFRERLRRRLGALIPAAGGEGGSSTGRGGATADWDVRAGRSTGDMAAGGDDTYLRCFSGHTNGLSIKECAWLGPSSGHVVSGSDEGDLWLWDACTAELLAVLPASQDAIINSVQVGCASFSWVCVLCAACAGCLFVCCAAPAGACSTCLGLWVLGAVQLPASGALAAALR